MPYQAAGPASSSIAPASSSPRATRAVGAWLWTVAVLIGAMVIVGGATRLTESGLSITEWKPIAGALPPLSGEAWQAEFDKYRATTQYRELNQGMSLADFRFIYYWEWAHRLLGRVIGVVFALPLLFFWWRGALGGALGRRLLVILAFGALQGAVGWWMVASGLAGRTSVAPYRLAVHLTLAFGLFAAVVWTARSLRPRQPAPGSDAAHLGAAAVLVFAFLQAFLGAIVAGLDAGRSFNTWPLMDGGLVPATRSLLALEPAWRNLFENPMAAQFAHRLGAYVLFAVALLHALTAGGGPAGRRAWHGFAIVLAQASLGVLTLVHVVPLGLALAHQFGALLVIGFATADLERFAGTRPRREAAAGVGLPPRPARTAG